MDVKEVDATVITMLTTEAIALIDWFNDCVDIEDCPPVVQNLYEALS